MRVAPASTYAPEAQLNSSLEDINQASRAAYGFPILGGHTILKDLVKQTHRFRVTDDVSLLSLAKDLARLTADLFDAAAIQRVVQPPPNIRWGTLKSLEGLLATKVSADEAHTTMSPLFHIYDLRLGDAHLPRKELLSALAGLGISETSPMVIKGRQMIESVVLTLQKIARIIFP